MGVLRRHMHDRRTIMRDLGECVAHIVEAVRAPVEGPEVVARRERVEEHVVDTPQGPMVARRTVVEELVKPAQATEQRGAEA